MMESERRSSIRYSRSIPVLFSIMDREDYKRATLCNESARGMYLETMAPLERQTPLIVEFLPLEAEGAFKGSYSSRIGKVRWCRKLTEMPSKYGVGIEYTAKAMAIGASSSSWKMESCAMCGVATKGKGYLTDESLWLCGRCFRFFGSCVEGEFRKSLIDSLRITTSSRRNGWKCFHSGACLLEHLDELCFFFSQTPGGEITFMSGNVEKVLGISPLEVTGRRWSEIARWTTCGEAIAASILKDRPLGLNTKSVNVTFIHPDGEKRGLEVWMRPAFDEDGAMARVDGMARQVFEEHRSEAGENPPPHEGQLAFMTNFGNEMRTLIHCGEAVSEIVREHPAFPDDLKEILDISLKAFAKMLGAMDQF